MGVVYTPLQIESGHFPRTGDHEKLGQSLLELVSEDGPIVGGLVYGSAAYGVARTRSDLDVLFVHQETRTQDAMQQVQEVIGRAWGQGVYVQTELHFEPTHSERPGMLQDVSYAMHLKRAYQEQEDWSRGDLSLLLAIRPPSVEEKIRDALSFFEAKRLKFTKTAGEIGIDYGRLQRAFELPAASWRKIALATDQENETGTQDVDKRSAIDRAREFLELYKDRPRVVEAVMDSYGLLSKKDQQCTDMMQDFVHWREKGVITAERVGKYALWVSDVYRESMQEAAVLSGGLHKILSSMVR